MKKEREIRENIIVRDANGEVSKETITTPVESTNTTKRN